MRFLLPSALPTETLSRDSSLRDSPLAGNAGRYRPDIDGLRAVAVLGVVFFHYGFAPFSGGFVGVDVFFVISGYLITAIVDGEFAGDRFSVLSFYERRLRRIVPALLVLLLFCAIASAFILLPNDMRLVGSSLTNAALFTSNILFDTVADNYFDADNLILQPLLHTWSLSVEAQFYLVYPWLLLFLRRQALPWAPTLLALSGLSFLASAWGVIHSPPATFYFLPTRAWELLLGGVLAVATPMRFVSARLGRLLGLAGLGFLAIGMFLFDRSTPFPGAAALLPCLGAALIILAGTRSESRGTLLGRSLGVWPMAFLGRISYSLYLWHWPILVFASYGRSRQLDPAVRLELILLAGAVSAASWWLIERPVITRRLLAARRRLFAGAAAGTAVAVLIGVAVDHAGRGDFPLAHLPADVLTLANGQFDVIKGECLPEDTAKAADLPCRFGAPGKDPTMVLWGNSYARMWTPALDINARGHGVAGISMLRSKCQPLLGESLRGLSDCAPFNQAAFDYIRARPTLKTVILGANWFAAGDQLAALGETIAKLREIGATIFVLLAPPQAAYPVPRTLAMAALRHEPPPPPTLQAQAREAQKGSTDLIEALRLEYGFGVIDPATVLCDGLHCAVEKNGHSLYFDAGHVTLYAALNSAGLFDPIFAP